MITSMLDGWPVEINDIGIVADTLDALIIAIKKAARPAGRGIRIPSILPDLRLRRR